MEHIDYEAKLKEAGIRVTAVRLLVYRTVYEQMSNAFSLQDVMERLPHADNSSVFRTLTLLAEKHLLHLIDDGSNMQKYCVCHCGKFHCHHAHLTCTVCHETVCLKNIKVPPVEVPEGYIIHEAEFVIKGICPKCQALRHMA